MATLVVLGLAGGAIWYFREPLGNAYEAVVDRVAGNEPIHPGGVSASSEREDRPASYAADGVSNRAWSPEGAGPGESITFQLDSPRRLVRLIVTAGNGGGEEVRLTEARPERVRLTVTTSEGEQVEDVTLLDTGEPQEVALGISEVTAVELTIQSVYGAQLQAPVSFAEVEFRGRG